MKKYWKDTFVYQRLLEVLSDYWLEQPDEASVVIDVQFLHRSGEYQAKHLVWDNPNIQWPNDNESDTLTAKQLLDKLLNGECKIMDDHIHKRSKQLREMRT